MVVSFAALDIPETLHVDEIERFRPGAGEGFVGLVDRAVTGQAAPKISEAGRNQGNSVEGIARSEEHTSELQSLMRISYAVFCLKKKKQQNKHKSNNKNKTNQKPQ